VLRGGVPRLEIANGRGAVVTLAYERSMEVSDGMHMATNTAITWS
jgi:hypothetical protein